MKLSAIKRVCLDAKQFCIYDDEGGRQWIGTKSAAYPVGGELFSEANIDEIFDLTPKQAEKVEVRREEWETSELCMRMDVAGLERARMLTGLPVYYLGMMMQPLEYREKLYLVLMRDIRAAAINGCEYMSYYMGEDARGKPLVIISDGMINAGVVRPVPKEISKGVLSWMREYAALEPEGSTREMTANEGAAADSADGQVGMDELEDGGDEEAGD